MNNLTKLNLLIACILSALYNEPDHSCDSAAIVAGTDCTMRQFNRAIKVLKRASYVTEPIPNLLALTQTAIKPAGEIANILKDNYQPQYA